MHAFSSLRILASWCLITEFVRRHPEFWVVEDHPGGGLYDCLVVVGEGQDWLWGVNREGGLHLYKGRDQSQLGQYWPDRVIEGELKACLEALDEALNLRCQILLPTTTPRTLVYRTISTLLRLMFLGKRSADCRMGYEDSSGCTPASAVREAWFQCFPQAAEYMRTVPEHDGLHPAYRFWFIALDEEPVLCLSDDGVMYKKNGDVICLNEGYKNAGRKLVPMLVNVVPELLP